MRDIKTEKSVRALVTIFIELRKTKGLSQEKLAHKVGIHRTAVSLIERGERTPTIATCMRIAKALDARLSDLLCRVE